MLMDTGTSPQIFGSKVKKSKGKTLLKIRYNFGGIIADEQNKDTCVTHKGKDKCSVNCLFTKFESIRTLYVA